MVHTIHRVTLTSVTVQKSADRSLQNKNIEEKRKLITINKRTSSCEKKTWGFEEQTVVTVVCIMEPSKDEVQAEPALIDSLSAEQNSRCESPKRGTTLSTSTSSFEALDPHDPNLSRLANTMFQKTGEYLQEELTATHADYRLLERLNKETIAKYTELKVISSNVVQSLDSLNDKYQKLQPILDNINQIDDSVSKLEQAAYKLAAYSKRLEAKFKDLEKDTKNK